LVLTGPSVIATDRAGASAQHSRRGRQRIAAFYVLACQRIFARELYAPARVVAAVRQTAQTTPCAARHPFIPPERYGLVRLSTLPKPTQGRY
jgi:hypothetical protein